MTLKNNSTLLLCYLKLCVSFHSHRSIQTGVMVRKREIRVKAVNFLSPVTVKFGGWPWKTIGRLSYATSSFVHHLIAICEFKLIYSYSPETVKLVLISVTLTFDLWPWPFAQPSLLLMVLTPEKNMMIRWWKHSEKGVTDRRTERRAEPFIELLGRS